MADSIPFFNRAGEVLILGYGAKNGLYKKFEGVPVPPPQNVIAPVFITTTKKVNEVVAIFPGDWVPSYTVVTVQIGVGTSPSNFSYLDATTGQPFILGESGTIPSAWVGERLSALVLGATSGGIFQIFVDSGLTIEAATASFPANISSDKWTVTEKRDEAPEGRRTVLIDSSVSVPVGYQIKFYSNTASGGLPGVNAQTITPGVSFTTNGSLSVGTICYNSLAWFRESDGAIARAHPLSEQKSFIMQGLTTTTNPPGQDPEMTPDATVGTIAAVRSQIQSWINNWNGTIPAGKTADDDRVVGINVSTSGTFDLSGLINNQATKTSRRIFVRAVGTYSHFNCSVKHTGFFKLDNSRGIWVTRMKIVGGFTNPGSFTTFGSDICGITRNMIQGAEIDTSINPSTTVINGSLRFGAWFKSSTNITITHNLFRYTKENLLTLGDNNGMDIWGNVFDWPEQDNVVNHGYMTNLIFDRNWGARNYIQPQGNSAHADFFQNQGRTTQTARYYGNVYMASWLAWWYGGAFPFVQGFFYRPDAQNLAGVIMPITNTMVEQNIMFHNNGSWKATEFTTSSNVTIRDNMFVSVGDNNDDPGTRIQGGNIFQRNFMCAFQAEGSVKNLTPSKVYEDGVLRQAGVDGVLILTGPYQNRNYTALTDWFQNGIPLMTGVKTMKNPPGMLSDILPKTGTRLHWLFGGTKVGPTERLREIFDESYRIAKQPSVGYPLVPGDLGWPVAKCWDNNYNSDGVVTSKISRYTAYDSNGDIVE